MGKIIFTRILMNKATCLLILTAVAWMKIAPNSASAQDTRPNFVFVLTDDHRYDAMGVVQREQGERARFPWFETPSMDRMAEEGVRFRNAFVTTSLCSPSRAAFLTGTYNHNNGIVYNNTPFPGRQCYLGYFASRWRIQDRLCGQMAHGKAAWPTPRV